MNGIRFLKPSTIFQRITCSINLVGIQPCRPTVVLGMFQQQQQQQQQRFISKYVSKAARKRMPLTTKRAGKGFYKGEGSTKEGRLTSKGRFISDPLRRLELMVPDLEGFMVSRIYFTSDGVVVVLTNRNDWSILWEALVIIGKMEIPKL